MDIFKKALPCSGNFRKNQILIYPRTMNILFCKRVEIFKSFISIISSLSANLLKKYNFTCWLLVCILFEVFQVELLWKYNKKLHFRIKLFLFSPMLKSCWIHSKNNFLFFCSSWWNELWSKTYKNEQNPEPAVCRCSAG